MILANLRNLTLFIESLQAKNQLFIEYKKYIFLLLVIKK